MIGWSLHGYELYLSLIQHRWSFLRSVYDSCRFMIIETLVTLTKHTLDYSCLDGTLNRDYHGPGT